LTILAYVAVINIDDKKIKEAVGVMSTNLLKTRADLTPKILCIKFTSDSGQCST